MRKKIKILFKNKNFFKLWGTQLTSIVCANMLNFVLMDKIYSVTGSTIAIGLFWGFYLLPTLTLGPFSGVIIDHFSKRKILVLSNLPQALIVLFYLGIRNKIWLIYPIVMLYSLCDEFFYPAVAASVPAIIRKQNLALANTILFFTNQAGLVIGYLSGGLLLRFLFFNRLPFFLASFLLLLGSFIAFLLPKDKPAVKKKLEASIKTISAELKEGYLFVRQEPRIFIPLLFLVGLQVVLGTGLIVLPPMAKQLFMINFRDAPFIIILPIIIGAILGAIITNRLLLKYLKRKVFTAGLLIFGVGLVSLFLFSFLRQRPVSLGSFIVLFLGLAFVLMIIPLQTLIQEHTPFKVRGRVFGLLGTLINLAAALPIFISASIIDFFGIRFLLLIFGLGCLILVWWVIKKWPDLNQLLA